MKRPRPINERESIVEAYVNGEINKRQAAELLHCTERTVTTYKGQYLSSGRAGLVDHRRSNHCRLTESQKKALFS